jgi:hypothetical protein
MKRLLLHVAALALASALMAAAATTASADAWKPGQVSKITAGPGSYVKITDHETFGSDEVAAYYFTGTSLGALGYSTKAFGPVIRSWCAGGEVRVELETRGWTMDPVTDTMRVEARIKLYEGASCSNNDLDGSTTWKEVYLHPGSSHSLDFQTWNTQEGGDEAFLRVNLTASK